MMGGEESWSAGVADERGVARAAAKAGRGQKVALSAARLRYCQRLLTHRVAEALPEIVDPLTEKAKEGSVPHTQALLKLAALQQRAKPAVAEAPRRRGKSLAMQMVEQLRRDAALKGNDD